MQKFQRRPILNGGGPIRPVSGNIAGLKPSHLKALERTYHRRVTEDRLISPELARHLTWMSLEIGRQIGVLIDRRGDVQETFVGSAQRIYLPDVGRHRAGLGRFRQLRHVHTIFGETGLQAEDLADLTKLRLDAVCTLEVQPDGGPGAVEYAYLESSALQKSAIKKKVLRSVHDLPDNFLQFIEQLEANLDTPVARAVDDKRMRAMVVGLYPDRPTSEWRTREILELAATAGVLVVDVVFQLRRDIDPKYVIGRGKMEEVVLRCLDAGAELIIIDHDLSPAQARAIAAFSELKVIDRTQLILDIFAQHAKSRDGKLQVELAQLKYALPRLTDLDAGLSRLTGGIGGRGPGETKLEINRRRARDRITRLEREIGHLSERRAMLRTRRLDSRHPNVAIVGYTNAGKSTLLNALTKSDVLVADQLFATLDSTSRRLYLGNGREAIVTDTVGFIRDLPPDLLRAFRATLEELESADLILHVVDVSDGMRDAKIKTVNDLLKELSLHTIPSVLVFNKADLTDALDGKALARRHDGVLISAAKGVGLSDLTAKISEQVGVEINEVEPTAQVY